LADIEEGELDLPDEEEVDDDVEEEHTDSELEEYYEEVGIKDVKGSIKSKGDQLYKKTKKRDKKDQKEDDENLEAAE